MMSFSCPLHAVIEVHLGRRTGGGLELEEAGGGPALARGTRWQKAAERADRQTIGRGRSCDKNDSIIIGAKVVLLPCKGERKERNGTTVPLSAFPYGMSGADPTAAKLQYVSGTKQYPLLDLPQLISSMAVSSKIVLRTTKPRSIPSNESPTKRRDVSKTT